MINYLLAHSSRMPHKTAFIVLEDGERSERKISYSELLVSVEKLAFLLTTRQLEEQRVLLVYQDVVEFLIAFMACQYSGVIPVPVPPGKGAKQITRLVNIMKDAGVNTILCAQSSIAGLQENLLQLAEGEKMAFIPTDTIPLTDGVLHSKNVPADNIAFIQYTSGSTGVPKGVVITNRNLIHNQQLIKSTFGCEEDSMIFSWLPFHHDMGLIGNILHTIYVGCTCVVMSPLHFIQRPQRWLEAISKYRITHSGGPNFSYDLCMEKIASEQLNKLDLSTWRVAYNGSEPIRPETMRRFSEYFKPAGFKEAAFHPCYGLAEATLLVSGLKNDQSPATLFIDREGLANGKIELSTKTDAIAVQNSGGVPVGMDVRILADTDEFGCRDCLGGEICIAGDSVTNGYWNKHDRDSFYIRENKLFLKTGDLGFFYRGNLFVHGRLKEMLIIRGCNFFPYDMEEAVSGCDQAIESNGVAVFGIDEHLGKFVVVAEVKRTFVNNLNIERIIYLIEKTIAHLTGASPYEILLTVPLGIPRTTSGKIQRLKCKELYLANAFSVVGAKSRTGYNSMEAEMEEDLSVDALRQGDYQSIKKYLIHLIRSRIINMPEDVLINGDSLLTEMGIDSIKGMELINRINREFHVNLDMAKVFQNNTFGGLVAAIEQKLWLKIEQTNGKEITI